MLQIEIYFRQMNFRSRYLRNLGLTLSRLEKLDGMKRRGLLHTEYVYMELNTSTLRAVCPKLV